MKISILNLNIQLLQCIVLSRACTCVCVCMYVCMYVYMYVHVHVHVIHNEQGRRLVDCPQSYLTCQVKYIGLVLAGKGLVPYSTFQ